MKSVRNNDQLAGIELESLKNSVEILEQRIDDLEKRVWLRYLQRRKFA